MVSKLDHGIVWVADRLGLVALLGLLALSTLAGAALLWPEVLENYLAKPTTGKLLVVGWLMLAWYVIVRGAQLTVRGVRTIRQAQRDRAAR